MNPIVIADYFLMNYLYDHQSLKGKLEADRDKVARHRLSYYQRIELSKYTCNLTII